MYCCTNSTAKKHECDVYSVSYNTKNHLSVLTQMWGSVWPHVLPYCLLNVALLGLVDYLQDSYDYDLSVTDKGHALTNMFIAFLIISRVTMSLNRYNVSLDHLITMYRETRELVQNACLFTKEDQSDSAKQWRHDLAYHACLHLRLAMAVIDYPSSNKPCWEIPELQGSAKEYLCSTCQTVGITKRWSHFTRGLAEDNMRVPIRAAYLIRDTLSSSKSRVETKFEAWQWIRMHGNVDSFMKCYYGLRKLMTTPFPFPLVQMARTFLFIYVYTLPFALLSDNSDFTDHALIIFFMTYGLVGLEYVSIDMDDPFGDDPNDFNNLAMALTAFEDVYVNIYMVDGCEWADKLRLKMCTGPEELSNLPPDRKWLIRRRPAINVPDIFNSNAHIDSEDTKFFDCQVGYTDV